MEVYYIIFSLNNLSLLLTHLLKIIIHATGLSKFLGKSRYPTVVYKAEDEEYFVEGGMGVTTVGQHKMKSLTPSLPTSPRLKRS